MKLFSFILVLILFSLTFGIKNQFAQTVTQKTLTTITEDEIRESVFRYQFTHNASGQQQKAKVYFLSVEGKDPNDDFIKRFKGNKPVVKKLSQAKKSGFGVFDKKTKKQGLIFSTGLIEIISENEVKVHGGYFEGGLSSSGNIYTVKLKDKWIVTDNYERWIS